MKSMWACGDVHNWFGTDLPFLPGNSHTYQPQIQFTDDPQAPKVRAKFRPNVILLNLEVVELLQYGIQIQIVFVIFRRGWSVWV